MSFTGAHLFELPALRYANTFGGRFIGFEFSTHTHTGPFFLWSLRAT
jgi:hypothetical protein